MRDGHAHAGRDAMVSERTVLSAVAPTPEGGDLCFPPLLRIVAIFSRGDHKHAQ